MITPNPFDINGMNPYGMDSAIYSPMMGLAAGLLQAGGPSREPVGLGQALGAGLQNAQQFQQQGIQNQMGQIDLARAKAQLGFLQGMGNNSMPQDLQGQYQYFLRGAQAGLPGYADLASQIRTQMMSQVRNLDPKNHDDLKLMGGTPPPAGQTYQYNDFTHKLTTAGEQRYQDVTWQSPTDGSIVHGRMDKTTGQVTPFNIPGTGTASKPKPGDEVVQTADGPVVIPAAYKSMVHNIASYNSPMPAASTRNPILAKNMQTWVSAVNPDWSQGNFAAKNEVLKSAAGGADAKKLDAFNTIQSHLASLQQAWAALKNGDIQSANKLANWAGIQFGSSAPSNAQIVNTLVGRELAAVLASGGQVTDADKKEANVINTMLSSGQQEGAIQNIKNLIGGKTNSVVTRFKASHLSDNDIKSRFTPDAWNAYQDFANSQQPQTPSANGWSIHKIP